MSVLLLSLGCSRVYTRYTRPACGPPVRSQARPGSASTDRSGCAGIKSNPPTWVWVTKTRPPNPAGPSPSGSTFTKILPPPCPDSVRVQACAASGGARGGNRFGGKRRGAAGGVRVAAAQPGGGDHRRGQRRADGGGQRVQAPHQQALALDLGVAERRAL